MYHRLKNVTAYTSSEQAAFSGLESLTPLSTCRISAGEATPGYGSLPPLYTSHTVTPNDHWIRVGKKEHIIIMKCIAFLPS